MSESKVFTFVDGAGWVEYGDFSNPDIKAKRTRLGMMSWVRVNSRSNPALTFRLDVDGQAIAYYVAGVRVAA